MARSLGTPVDIDSAGEGSNPKRPLALGETLADRYELRDAAATGGMSSVYKAYDLLLERWVALKVLHPHLAEDSEYVTRFRREARAVAQLSHPNIVNVIDRGEADGRHYIVYELVDGEDLRHLLDREGPLPASRAIELATGIAAGLAFAHEHGFVHRDVKPQNILITSTGEVKVTDFGIARSLDPESGLTETGTVIGTGEYLSPEQAQGLPVTPTADIYALGVVVFELLAGEVPFRGESIVTVAARHANEPPPHLLDRRPDLPPRLAAAVDRALAKSPEDRFPTMGAFAAELRHSLDEPQVRDGEQTLVTPAAPVASRPRRHSHGRRIPALLVVLGSVAAAVVIAVALLTTGGHPIRQLRGGAAAATGSAVTLQGIGNDDPSGPPDTHADTAGAATDGNPKTFWYTQIYASPQFGGLKHGLGLKLDAGRQRGLKQLTVTTDTPGFKATVLAGNSATGSFAADSASRTVAGSTTFALRGTKARYYVLWITSLPPGDKADVNEVTARV
ncbi:MAG TPA: protein kinase [Gaiellaceae bacterium]|nr:protein kinase [Gaiellaceae bacterium]